MDLARSIQDEGLLSALFITRDETQDSVHPGKQRVRALRHLGTGTAPAVIWSKNNQALPGERDISLDEARQLLPGHDLRLTKCGYACVAKD